MVTHQDRQYHVERARSELDCAYRAEGRRAAEAHLRLSALHMERLKRAEDARASASPGGPDKAKRPTATAGRVVKTPGAEEQYKAVLEREGMEDIERPVSTVREGEDFIRRHSPAAPEKPKGDSWNP